MSMLWLRIRVWVKIVAMTLVGSYLLFFLLFNSGQSVNLWLFFRYQLVQIPLLLVVLLSVMFGAVAMLLVGMIGRTFRQFRELSQQRRLRELERERAEREKAARLQIRPENQSPKHDESGE